jgi:AcrR family transcriptional regulator
MSLRERKRAETRATILRAALHLLEERGYDGTTTESIAAGAGVSLPTVFRYFPSKSDLLFADDAERVEAWIEAFMATPPDRSLRDALRAGTRAVLTLSPDDHRLATLRARLVLTHPELRQRALLTDAIATERAAVAIAKRQGWNARRDLEPHVVARAALGAMRAAQSVAVTAGGEFDELADGAWELLDRLPALLRLTAAPARPQSS